MNDVDGFVDARARRLVGPVARCESADTPAQARRCPNALPTKAEPPSEARQRENSRPNSPGR